MLSINLIDVITSKSKPKIRPNKKENFNEQYNFRTSQPFEMFRKCSLTQLNLINYKLNNFINTSAIVNNIVKPKNP